MPDFIELGLDTFGDVTFDSAGKPLPQAQVLRNGALPHEKLLTSIELYGTRVVPLVRKALAAVSA